jgi:ribosome-binding factor A
LPPCGATRAWYTASASTIWAPSCRNIWLAVDLPLPMPPVRPQSFTLPQVAEAARLDKDAPRFYDPRVPEFEHKRAHRVAQLVQEELGRLFVEGLRDPRIGFVTVTEVRLTDDLRGGHVYVSVFGDDEKRTQSITGLKAAAGYLRREIGHRLKLRYAPELHFALDATLDHAQRLEVLFIAAARGEHETPEPFAPDALPPVEIDRLPVSKEPLPLRRRKSPPARRKKFRSPK